MAYQCKACGNKTSKASPTGACPACQSMNLVPIKKQDDGSQPAKKRSAFDVSFLAILLIILCYWLYREYL